MISERDIAEKFNAIWKQHFPLLTPNFMRVFNAAQIKTINTTPVSNKGDIRYDLISEIAFNLSEICYNQNITPSTSISNNNEFKALTQQTARTIWTTGNYTNNDLELNPTELQEVTSISNNILEFISKFSNTSNIEFKPKLKGYSFIPDLEADISINDTLFEIKTVNRNFKSSDLKQIFIYLSLKQVKDKNNWTFAGLYNPKRGTYCRFNIKSLIFSLTGGKTPNEALENLLNSLVRDIELDSKF